MYVHTRSLPAALPIVEPGVNREWAYVGEDAGKAGAVSREEAVARHGQASLVWVHLNGRDSGTLEWLRDRRGIPYPAFLALTAVETRPRPDFLDRGAIVNLRGLGATPHDDPDTLVSIRLWAEAGFVISISYRHISAVGQFFETRR